MSREASPDDGRGVVATITDRAGWPSPEAMITYGICVKAHFLGQLSRPQVAAMGRTAGGSAPG